MKKKNTKKVVQTILLQLLCIALLAQSKTSVSGLIKDSAAQKPLQYATVELFRASQLTQPVKSVYTNEKGKFNLTAIDTGVYILIFSHVGFAEKQQNINVTSQPLELQEINLTAAPSSMKGVTVTARKPLVEQSDDKIVFNVENDPATKTETAIDILRKTPFVSVDGDDNVTVNGQTNFKVLLNGRETAMFAQNVKEALKGFPGALITKIEVITTPSAKYDAEGVGGVINIITKKKVVGYNGSINTYYGSTGWFNINTNFSAKFGKLGITMYYGGGGTDHLSGTSQMQTLPFVPATFTRRELLGSRTWGNFWNFGNVEASYDVDTLTTFSFYGNISGGNNRSHLNQSITTYHSAAPDSVSYYDLQSRNEYPTRSIGLDYIKHFSNKKEKEFSIRFNNEFGNSNTSLNSVMDNPAPPDRYIINNSIAKNSQYTLQSDYVYPLVHDQKLEAGVKAIMRKASSNFESLLKAIPNDDYKLNPDNTDYFRYNQNVYSVYGTYSIKIKKTTFRLGARMEHTEVDGNFISAKTAVKQSYSNVMPNLQASIKMSNVVSLVISYSDRLQRPFINNLNPFKNNNDPLNITYGNPNLNAQIIHSLSVQARLIKGPTFAGITFTGSYSNNMIVQHAGFDTNTGVTTTTSGNYGKEAAISAIGNISTKLNKDWSVFLNGSIRYNHVENKMLPSQTNSGFSGNANLNTSYSINKRFTASGYSGFYRNPVSIQTSYPLNIWYGINAGYKFFNEKLTASLGASNFLQKDRQYKLITKDPLFQYTSISTFPFRALSFSLTWNFGKLKENVSKKKGVTNDDLLNSGNN